MIDCADYGRINLNGIVLSVCSKHVINRVALHAANTQTSNKRHNILDFVENVYLGRSLNIKLITIVFICLGISITSSPIFLRLIALILPISNKTYALYPLPRIPAFSILI